MVLGLACAAFTAVLGALILGEYEFTGTLPYVAGPLFGLVLGEVVVGVGRTHTVVAAAITSVLGFAALVWAGWISSGEGLNPIATLVWVAAALAAICAYVRIAGLTRVHADDR